MTTPDPTTRLAAALNAAADADPGVFSNIYHDDGEAAVAAAVILAVDPALADALRTGLLLARLDSLVPADWLLHIRTRDSGDDEEADGSTPRWIVEGQSVAMFEDCGYDHEDEWWGYTGPTFPEALSAAIAALEAPDAR